MNSRTLRRFREMFAGLPIRVKQQARQAYRLFSDDPAHPGLHFKQVHNDPPIYSVRVGIGHRALGVLDGSKIIWFWIGPHAEYDKLLKRL